MISTTTVRERSGTTARGTRAPTGRWRFPRPDAVTLVLGISGLGCGLIAALAVGFRPELAAALYLAVVTPELVRTDLAEYRLPNRLVLPGYPLALAGLGAAWLEGRPPAAAFLGTAAVLAVFALLAVFGGLGMGDVKLAGLLALVLGPLGTLPIVASIVIAFLLGGIAALGHLVSGHSRRDLAFGPYLLAGGWTTLVIDASRVDLTAVLGPALIG